MTKQYRIPEYRFVHYIYPLYGVSSVRLFIDPKLPRSVKEGDWWRDPATGDWVFEYEDKAN